MSRIDPLLLETTRRILRAVADPQARHAEGAAASAAAANAGAASAAAANAGAGIARRAAAWRALADGGLTRAWLPEAAGGAGGGVADGFAILTLAGEVALDLPLAETLLAGWLLAAAGLTVPDGTLAPAGAIATGAAACAAGFAADGVVLDEHGRLRGRVTAVPFGREVDRLAVIGRRATGEPFAALIERAACRVAARDNLAGEPRDTVTVDGVAPIAATTVAADLHDQLWAMGAVARACQIAGALQGILARCVAYAGERVAFDRPIGKFQAIQHALARLAGEAAIALAASGSAADALASDTDPDGLFLEVASAKIRAGEAAAAGAAIAHQVHGAIGFSTEHPLHLFTRRLWAWRDDFGGESAWAVRLGARVAERGAGALWPLLAAR
jgi:acyl-CoA dehydrogenase